ncbi:MAG: PQQ-dependent sugar dehydrogenase, partial [Acetobacteraceae bacterium]
MSFASNLAACFALLAVAAPSAMAQSTPQPVSPYASWRIDAPGVLHRYTSADMLPLVVTPPVKNFPAIVPRPAGAELAVPPGFEVHVFKAGLVTPRTMRFAPNGDLFVAESKAGRITVLHTDADGSRAVSSSTFAAGLDWPFGIAFWPPGPHPRYVYVGAWDKVVRYPYRIGDTVARGPADPVIPDLPTAGHWTRGLAFSADGKHLFVSVGSRSNDAETMPKVSLARIHALEAKDGTGAAWGKEAGRATVLETTPSGHPVTSYANGLRNCVGIV